MENLLVFTSLFFRKRAMPIKHVETKALLTHIIGVAATLEMMQNRKIAGTTIEVPKNSEGRGKKMADFLIGVIGAEAALKLIAHFGGDRLYVPKDDAHKKSQRNRLIVETYGGGRSINQIASDFNLTDRRIREILKTTDMSAAH
ncbi:MAG: hypothetical protein HYZ65_04180 [Burkholderiales bacterium]|nr:hypothetical protein [Burkholderiales bacterium]